MRHHARSLIVLACLAVTGSGAGAQEPLDPVSAAIKADVEALRLGAAVHFGADSIAQAAVTIDLYERGAYAPLWADPVASAALLRAIRSAWGDGLDTTVYHLAALEAARPGAVAPEAAARLDLLRTDALVRLAHDLRWGRVDRDRVAPDTALSRPIAGSDAAGALRTLIDAGDVYAAVRALAPSHFVYAGLVSALAGMRCVRQAGGWPTVPGGPALRPDSADARVPALRRRLAFPGGACGDVAIPAPPDSTLFDAPLAAAVRAFQHLHGLNEDGIVGAQTLAELNTPVATRIDQVRVNLERARWVTHDLADEFVAVNAAGAKVYLVRGDSVLFETRAVVGKRYTETPSFSAPMRYVDLNPTWTVPPGIVGEVLAEVRRDRSWLRRQNMHVLDRAGRVVDPATIAFGRYTARDFPYVFRQEPGPLNPLGRIKLLFPNRYNVYLHDTPSRTLFEREERTFSHGCIRVQDPVLLASLVLDQPERWSVAALESAIESGSTATIPLAHPIPVLVLYWTAAVGPEGDLHFYRDPYGRDAALLRALDGR